MIKFFRKIRYNLMSENKTSRYFKYAIGEIILVVLGILIALQINNANEKRKARFQEITILENLKGDIALDTLDLIYNLNHYKRKLKAENQLLDFLRSDYLQPKDTIGFNTAFGWPILVVLHQSTFNNLQNNQIGLINNNKLHKDISRFYDYFNQAIKLIENEEPTFETYHNKKSYFKKYFKLDNSQYIGNNFDTNNKDYFNPNIRKNNYQLADPIGAKNDEGFKIELNESITFTQFIVGFYKEMINRSNEIIKEIDQELEQLKK